MTELILEQDAISRLPAGKLFLSIANQFGIKPDVGAFGRFLVTTSKDVLKFLKDKADDIAKALGNMLGTIASTMYVYYGEKVALSDNILELLNNIEKVGGLHKFSYALEKKTRIYGNLPRIYANLQMSPFKYAINKVAEELKIAFSNKAILARWQKIVKEAAAFNKSYGSKEYDLVNINVDNATKFQQMFILNNLEMREAFHKKLGHPFLWLLIFKGRMIPANIGKRGKKLSTVNWINKDYGLDRTGISEEWLRNALKPELLATLSEALSKNEALKQEATNIISDFSKTLSTLDPVEDKEELIKIIAVLDQNVTNGILFFGDEDIIFDIIETQLVNRQDIKEDEEKQKIVNAILYNTKNFSEYSKKPEKEEKVETTQTPRQKAIEAILKQLLSKLSGISLQTIEELKDTPVNDAQLAHTTFRTGLKNTESEHEAVEKMFNEKYPFKETKLTERTAIYEYLMRRNWNVLTLDGEATVGEFFRNSIKLTEKFIDDFDKIVDAYEEKVEEPTEEEKEEEGISLNIGQQAILKHIEALFQKITGLSMAVLKKQRGTLPLSNPIFKNTIFVLGFNNSEQTQKVVKSFILKLPYSNADDMARYTEDFIRNANAKWDRITENNELTLNEFFKTFVLFIELFHNGVKEGVQKAKEKFKEKVVTQAQEKEERKEEKAKKKKIAKKKQTEKVIETDKLYEYTAENQVLSNVIARITNVSDSIELTIEYSPHKDDKKKPETAKYSAGKKIYIDKEMLEKSNNWNEVSEDKLTSKLESEEVSTDEETASDGAVNVGEFYKLMIDDKESPAYGLIVEVAEILDNRARCVVRAAKNMLAYREHTKSTAGGDITHKIKINDLLNTDKWQRVDFTSKKEKTQKSQEPKKRKKKKLDEFRIETLDNKSLLLEVDDNELLYSINDFLVLGNNEKLKLDKELFIFNDKKIKDVLLTEHVLKLISDDCVMFASL